MTDIPKKLDYPTAFNNAFPGNGELSWDEWARRVTDILQDKEEASKPHKKNCKYMASAGYDARDCKEASKGECKQHSCEFYGCTCILDPRTSHCISKSWHVCNHINPPEQEDEWEKEIRDENWDTENGIMTKQVYLRHGRKIGTATTPLKVEMIIDYIKANFVSKEKIKRVLLESTYIKMYARKKILKSLGIEP